MDLAYCISIIINFKKTKWDYENCRPHSINRDKVVHKETILKMGHLLITIFSALYVLRISHKYVSFSNVTLNLKCSSVQHSVIRICYFSTTGERPKI